MRRRDKGAALVEAAFVIPFVLLLVFGVVDFARAYFDAAKVQEAAQEGAVFASFHPDSPADAITRAEESIGDPDFSGSVAVTCPSTDQVTVTVTYYFDLLTPLISNTFGSPIDLSHSETAHVLTSDECVAS